LSGEIAEAFFSYGGVLGCRDTLEKDIQTIEKNRQSKLGTEVFENPLPDSIERTRNVDKFADEYKLHPQTRLLLQKLVDDNLLWLMPKISDKFSHITKHWRGFVDVSLSTAKKLSPAEEKEWEKKIGDYLGEKKKPVLKIIHNPDLLEGYTVDIEGQFVDKSIATKIKQLKKQQSQAQNETNQNKDKASTLFEKYI